MGVGTLITVKGVASAITACPYIASTCMIVDVLAFPYDSRPGRRSRLYIPDPLEGYMSNV